MHTIFLQITGGCFYLSNKIFFAAAERAMRAEIEQKRRRIAWIFYLAGVAPWVAIFLSGRDWIAAAIESSGVPAILLGLIGTAGRTAKASITGKLDLLSRLMILAGLAMSLYDFGGIRTLNQVIELGVAAGFLFGTYFLAKRRASGYLWLLLGNVSAASLMMRQGYYILMVQQLLSTIFVSDALLSYRRKCDSGKLKTES